MKQLSILLLLLLSFYTQAQSCFPDGLILSTQQEIDDFATDYPSCTIIEGVLTIEETTENDITNLLGLSQITSCNGGLKIVNINNLVSLEGIDNIMSVSDRLEISYLPALTSLEHASNIGANSDLDVYIILNPLIPNLNGLSFSEIGGFTISKNNTLVDMSGLENLVETSSLRISNNKNLVTLNGLSSFTTENSSLSISMNESLENLDGLESFTEAKISFSMHTNRKLNDISALSNLKSVGYNFQIVSSGIESLEGLQGLDVINGNIRLAHNKSLTDISDLENVNPYKIGTHPSSNLEYPQLIITNNPELEECSINSVCYFLNRANILSEINTNKPGCNSAEDVSSNCEISTESCFPNGLTITSQSEIDEFSSSYPDCNTIEGDLTINSLQSDPVSSLVGLSAIHTINGSLIVENTTHLTNLEGLDAISGIGGALIVKNNISLESIEGIQNINPSSIVPDASGYAVVISNNSNLAYCNVQTICEFLTMSNVTFIEQNTLGCNSEEEIVEACELSAQSCFEGVTVISSQQEIDDFSSNYPDCINVVGDLTISESINGPITNLLGLSQLEHIQGLLIIEETSLKNLEGLNNMKSISHIKIAINDSLQHIDALENMTMLNDVFIAENALLQSLPDWTSITNINRIGLRLNPLLKDISGLSSIDTIVDYMDIYYCGLENLDGLSNLQYINRYLYLSYNTELINLDGLSSLVKIGNELKIRNNKKLISLSGLENIQFSDEDDMNGIKLEIVNNETLNHCNIMSVCDYIDIESNNAKIENNDISCNSIDEIQALCSTGIVEDKKENTLHVFPNPVNNKLYIESKYNEKTSIYNSFGMLVETRFLNTGLNTLNTVDYQRGVYYLKMENGVVESFVKLD